MMDDKISPPEGSRVTQVPNAREAQEQMQRTSSEFGPMKALTSERAQKKFWMAAALFGLLVGAISPIFIVASYERRMKEQPFMFALDGAGTIHAGPMERLTLQNQIFVTTAINGSQAALQRSPVGLDLPEVVAGIFRPDAAAKLKKDVEAQMPDIKARNLHQKPEISKVTALSENGGMRVLSVQGQLIRAGTVDGAPIADPSIPFQLTLAIMENPRMNERGQYPFYITDFRMSIQK